MGNHHFALCILLISLASVATASAADSSNNPPLDEIVVTATLRSISLQEMPGSVSVLTGTTLADAGPAHFQDVLALVPNLNWAGDTSQPRYFQVLGIGCLQQYTGA